MKIKESKLMAISVIIAIVIVAASCKYFTPSLDLITAALDQNNKAITVALLR